MSFVRSSTGGNLFKKILSRKSEASLSALSVRPRDLFEQRKRMMTGTTNIFDGSFQFRPVTRRTVENEKVRGSR